MRERISGNTKAEIFAFDFRARTDEATNAAGIASIWLWAICGDDGDRIGGSVASFVDWILERSAKGNICLYCFDLGFHWSFIVYELFSRGFEFTKRLRKDSIKKFNSFSRGGASIVYSATIKASKNHGIIFFKDLKQVYAGFKSLDEMAKSFRSSREFYPDDMEKEHPDGAAPTETEATNCRSRAGFVFDVLKRQESDPSFFQSFTLASHSIRRAIAKAFGKLNSPYMAYRSQKMFPRIIDPEEKEALRASIKGGLTGPTMKAIDLGFNIEAPMFVLDRTQSYPTEMRFSKLPRGRGVAFDGFKVGGGIRLYQIQINAFDGVRFHSLPALMQAHKHFMALGETPIRLWVWEWEYFEAYECYINLDCEVLGGYLYKKGVCPFGAYVEENQRERREFEKAGDYIQAAHLKALNVSLYGKLIQRDSTETTEQIFDEESGLAIAETKERKEGKESSYNYLPGGSAIPSLARWHLIKLAAKFGFDNVVYVETDCLIVLANPKTEGVLRSMELKKELGFWHMEAKALKAYFPMAKRYKYETEEGETIVKGAGIDSASFSGDYEQIKITGTTVEMRQKKPAKGGTLIIKIRKRLKGGN